jgi:hypothetical protein
MLFPVPFNWRILKKTVLFSGFKNPYKKSAKQENSSLFMNSILYNEKMRVAQLRIPSQEFFHEPLNPALPHLTQTKFDLYSGVYDFFPFYKVIL